MVKNSKVQIIAMLLAVGLLGWACSPCAADVRIAGQVQAGGGPVANATVTLWAAGTDQPAVSGIGAAADADGDRTARNPRARRPACAGP